MSHKFELPNINMEILLREKINNFSEAVVDVSKLNFVNPDSEQNKGKFEHLQSRSFYGSDREIEELSKSIKENGVLEALIVCEEGSVTDPTYTVLEGNRRAYTLHKILKEEKEKETPITFTPAGWSLEKVHVRITTNPDLIVKRQFDTWKNKLEYQPTDEQLEEAKNHIIKQIYSLYNKEALHRNVQRKEWTWLEQMKSWKYRIDNGENKASIAYSHGIADSTLEKNLNYYNNILQIKELYKALEENKINKSVAFVLLNADWVNKRNLCIQSLNLAIEKGLSQSQVEKVQRKLGLKKQNRKRLPSKNRGLVPTQALIDYFLDFLDNSPSSFKELLCEKLLDETPLKEDDLFLATLNKDFRLFADNKKNNQ